MAICISNSIEFNLAHVVEPALVDADVFCGCGAGVRQPLAPRDSDAFSIAARTAKFSDVNSRHEFDVRRLVPGIVDDNVHVQVALRVDRSWNGEQESDQNRSLHRGNSNTQASAELRLVKSGRRPESALRALGESP